MEGQNAPAANPWVSRDFIGGAILVLIGIAALVFTAGLPLGQLNNFGPRMFPMVSAIGVAGLGVVLMVTALRGLQEKMEGLGLRGPLFVVAGLVLFAITIRPLGLLPASFLVYFVGGLGSPEARVKELVFYGIVAAAVCSFLFVTMLGLPLSIVRLPWG
jgi:hypothetical protein